MRCATSILLCLLLHLAALVGMARGEDTHGEPGVAAVCGDHGPSTAPCHDGGDKHGCPEDADCPIQGDHCHHQGTCAVHGILLLHTPETVGLPAGPDARELEFEIRDSRAADGPVRKLDKPPLI